MSDASSHRRCKRDAWFWSPEWQKSEAEAQKNIDSGDMREFDSVHNLLQGLKGK